MVPWFKALGSFFLNTNVTTKNVNIFPYTGKHLVRGIGNLRYFMTTPLPHQTLTIPLNEIFYSPIKKN